MAASHTVLTDDVWTSIVAFLDWTGQAALRGTGRRMCRVFNLAVAYDNVGFAVSVADAAPRRDAPDDDGNDAADVAAAAHVSPARFNDVKFNPTRYAWAPANPYSPHWRVPPAVAARISVRHDQAHAAAAVVNWGLVNHDLLPAAGAHSATRIGHGFLAYAPLRFVFYRSAPRVTEAGDEWHCAQEGAPVPMTIDLSGLRSLKKVGDWWLSGIEVGDVDFSPLDELEEVGASWLATSSAHGVTFGALKALRAVGAQWLHGATVSLPVVVSGMQQLSSVGDGWFAGLTAPRIEVADLPELTDAGDRWLSGTRCAAVHVDNLPVLVRAGDSWLANTRATTVALRRLTALQTVGDRWLFTADQVQALDFSGCAAVQHVGHNWLGSCLSLQRVDCDALRELQTVADKWLWNCVEVTDVAIGGLRALRTVGGSWLGGCTALPRVSFAGLDQLTSVGRNWCYHADRLHTIDASGLERLAAVGPGAFQDCAALRRLDVRRAGAGLAAIAPLHAEGEHVTVVVDDGVSAVRTAIAAASPRAVFDEVRTP